MKTQEKYPVSAETLTTLGFQTAPYSTALKEVVYRLSKQLPLFFNQSMDHKKQYAMGLTGGYEGSDVNGRVDEKETLSISPRFDWSSYKYSQIDFDTFIYAGQVLDLMRIEMYKFALLVEEISGKSGIADRWMTFFNSWTLRLLYYHPTKNHLLADDHPDRGVATCVLWESIQGHQNLDLKNLTNWRDITVNDELIMFLGLVGQLLTDCRLKGLCHRVVSTPESRKHGRYSIVLFVDIDIFFNKKVYTNTRAEFGGGKNYLYDHTDMDQVLAYRQRFTTEAHV